MLIWFRRHWLPLTLALVYAAVMSALSILRHLSFHTQTFDLGIFEQSFWNTLRGQVMFNNFENANHLSVHFSPFLFLLVPLYAIAPGPYPLLILQAVALGSAAFPLYRLVAAQTNRRTAFVASLAYLLMPSLHGLNLFDFHEVAFAVPAFLWTLERIQAGRRSQAAVALAVAASTAESMVIAVAGVGCFLLLNRPSRRFGGMILLASTLYFLLVSSVLMPALGGKIYRFDRYATLGASPAAIVQTIVTRPQLVWQTVTHPEKLKYLGRLLAATAALPLLAPATLIMLVAGLAQNLLTDYSPQFTGAYQYDAIIIPFLMLGVAQGWQLIFRRLRKSVPSLQWLAVGASLAAFIWWSPLGLRAYPWRQFQIDDRARALAAIRDALPPNAKVAAATNLVPHLTHRDGVWMLGFEPSGLPDLIVIDLWDTTGFATNAHFQTYLERNLHEFGYRPNIAAQRFMLLEKNNTE